jgi:serine/threonine protein kinase
LLNEIRTLCEAPQVRGLVEFYGAFYSPDSGQISIALEYMDGGSLADIVRTKKFIPEPILSVITRKVLQVNTAIYSEFCILPRTLTRSLTLSRFQGDVLMWFFEGFFTDLHNKFTCTSVVY